ELVGWTDGGLLRLRIQAASLISGLNVVAFDRTRLAAFTPDDAEKIARFIDNLKRWRSGQGIVPLDVLISRILIDSGFRWTPGTLTGDNVEEFLRLARTRGTTASLVDFLTE